MFSCAVPILTHAYLSPSSEACSESDVREVYLLVIIHLDKPKPSVGTLLMNEHCLSYIFSLLLLIKK